MSLALQLDEMYGQKADYQVIVASTCKAALKFCAIVYTYPHYSSMSACSQVMESTVVIDSLSMKDLQAIPLRLHGTAYH